MNQRWTFLCALVAVFGCSGSDEKEEVVDKPASYAVLGEFVETSDSFPRVRYFEGNQIAPNDRCAVRKVKLNPKMPPVYVNGRPIGFC